MAHTIGNVTSTVLSSSKMKKKTDANNVVLLVALVINVYIDI
jgi:hypothetical protein